MVQLDGAGVDVHDGQAKDFVRLVKSQAGRAGQGRAGQGASSGVGKADTNTMTDKTLDDVQQLGILHLILRVFC